MKTSNPFASLGSIPNLPSPARPGVSSAWTRLLACLLLLGSLAGGLAQTANWIGDNSFKPYGGDTPPSCR